MFQKESLFDGGNKKSLSRLRILWGLICVLLNFGRLHRSKIVKVQELILVAHHMRSLQVKCCYYYMLSTVYDYQGSFQTILN